MKSLIDPLLSIFAFEARSLRGKNLINGLIKQRVWSLTAGSTLNDESNDLTNFCPHCF